MVKVRSDVRNLRLECRQAARQSFVFTFEAFRVPVIQKTGVLGLCRAGVIKWDPFWGNQTIQIYGNFEGFPPFSALFWVGNTKMEVRFR